MPGYRPGELSSTRFGELVGDYAHVHGYVAAEPGWQRILAEERSHRLSPIGIVGDPAKGFDEPEPAW